MDRLRSGGLSLPELLCVLAIVAVLASVAAASWSRVVQRIQVDTGVKRFTTSLWHARSEAIRRGSWVVLERLDHCPQQDWSCGWQAYIDRNNNAFLDEDDHVFHTIDTPHGLQVRVNASGLRQRIRLAPNGASHAVSAGSFFFEHRGGQACTRLLLSSGLRWRREACA